MFIILIAAEKTTYEASNLANGATGWELALVTAPSSNGSATAASKLVYFLQPITLK